MKATTLGLTLLLLLAGPAAAQDDPNAPPPAPPAGDEAKPAPADEGADEAKKEEEGFRLDPKAWDMIKKADRLLYYPAAAGLKTLEARLVAESPMGNIGSDVSYDFSREGELADKINLEITADIPDMFKSQAARQLKGVVEELFVGKSGLEVKDTAHVDYLEKDGKGQVKITFAKGPMAGTEVTRTYDAETGIPTGSVAVMTNGGEATAVEKYEKKGEKYRLVSVTRTFSMPNGMTQEVEMAMDYMECGDFAMPFRFTQKTMMGESKIWIEGVVVNGKKYSTPEEQAAAEATEEKPASDPVSTPPAGDPEKPADGR